MRRYRQTIALAILTLALAAGGCAIHPREPVPSGLTVDQAIGVLTARQAAVSDFSARARATFTENGVPQNATLVIRYLAPGRCRVYIKGFAGIDMARISVLSDSATVYVPPENYYFTLPRSYDYVIAFAPGVEIGFDMFDRLFTTTVPGQNGHETSLDRTPGGEVVLTFVRGPESHRLVLSGADLLVTSEEYIVGNTPVWRKTIDSYTTVDGIPFPSSVTVTAGDMSAELSLSNIELNVGFTEESLTFPISPSVERYTGGIEN